MRFVTPLRRSVMRMVYTKRLNPKWGRVLAKMDVWPLNTAGVDHNGNLTLPGGITILEPTQAGLDMITAHRAASDLAVRAGAKFDVRHERIAIQIDGLKGLARNVADIQVFHEIFVERFYTFEFPGPYFVMDIGANLGLASLFFAKEYDADVIAYELVGSSAKLAQANLDLNPALASKIRLEAVGLADKDQELEIEVDAAIRSSNSLFETNLTASKTTEKVQVRDAGPAVQNALEQANGKTFVLKVDAEGAEYEIFERLRDLDLLKKVDVLFLEWHERKGKDPQFFRDLLKEAGFISTERMHPEAPVGLINAFRR